MTEYREPDVVMQPTAAGPTASMAPSPQSTAPEKAPLKDRAGDAAETGKQAAGDLAATAQDKAKDVVQESKHQARNVLAEAQDQLRNEAGSQHRNLVGNLRSLGDELRAMSDRSEQSGMATDLVSQAGDRAHGVASWLDEREPGELIDELRTFARRRPGAFLAGCAVLGVVAGRLTRGVVAAHSDDSGDGCAGAGASSAPVSGQGWPTGAAPVEPYPSSQTDEFPTAPTTAPAGASPAAEPYPAPAGAVQYPAGAEFPPTTGTRP